MDKKRHNSSFLKRTQYFIKDVISYITNYNYDYFDNIDHQSTIFYDGYLNPQILIDVKSFEKCIEWVEVDDLRSINFSESSFWKDYEFEAEDCMGCKYTKISHDYVILSKNFFDKNDHGAFIGFVSSSEYNGFLNEFGGYIVNRKPFKTAIM